MKDLTKAEEQVMQVLWKLGQGFVNEMLDHFEEPKPAYNTISTIVRILEKKGFVNHKSFGKTHQYFPLISKREYTSKYFGGVMKRWFSGSYKSLASFLANDKNMSLNDLEEMKLMIEKQIDKKKSNHE